MHTFAWITCHSTSPATAPELLAYIPSELRVQCKRATTSEKIFNSYLNTKVYYKPCNMLLKSD